MLKKKELLSIGEISNATGVGIKSLKYYENIGILKPAYIEAKSNYRYYSLKQAYWIEIIQLSVEFGMPLKELKQYIDDDEQVDYTALTLTMKEKLHHKMIELQAGLKFIDYFERDMELTEHFGQDVTPYSLDLEEKYFFVFPCEANLSKFEQREIYSKMISKLAKMDCEAMFWDCGFLHEYLPNGKINRYAYVQIPSKIPDCLISPKGSYSCLQSKESQIERTKKIFPKIFLKNSHCLAIEMDIHSNYSSYRNVRKELRVISL